MSKVLILAISDKYWVDFAINFSKRLEKEGLESIVVLDSRIGEYQLYAKRIKYNCSKVYYLSDYVNKIDIQKLSNLDLGMNSYLAVYNDYLRLRKLGLLSNMVNSDFSESYSILSNFFDTIFNENEIKVVVHETISSSFSYVASNMANNKNIKYIGFVSAKIPNRFELKTSVNSDSTLISDIYNSIMNKDILVSSEENNWATEYLETLDNQIQGFMKTGTLNNLSWTNLLNNKNFKMMIGTILYTIKEREDQKGILFRSYPLIQAINSFKRNTLRRIRKPFLKKYFDSVSKEWLENNSYYIYPIHFQPEASTTIGAPFFDDQLELLIKISFCLPKNRYLLIKEHRSNIGYNNSSFYNELKRLPNVKLISENQDIKYLIRKSVGLLTLTGTAGFEAILLNKPVFIFGDVSYDKHPLCCHFKTWEEMPLQLEMWPVKCKSIDYDNQAFLIAYRRYTFSGNIDYNEQEFNIGSEYLEIISNR